MVEQKRSPFNVGETDEVLYKLPGSAPSVQVERERERERGRGTWQKER